MSDAAGAATATTRKAGKVLVTGVRGGLGRLLAERLAARYDVIGVDREACESDPSGCLEVLQLELQKKSSEDVFRRHRIDAVVHLDFHDDLREPARDRYRVNVLGTMRLLDFCDLHLVKRVVILSAAAVYGAYPDNPMFLTEDAPLRAAMAHGDLRDRVELDTYAQAWMWRHPEVSTVIFRPCNILGPTCRNPFRSYLRMPVAPILMGFDPMMQVIHETDVVRALELALRADRTGVYNLAGPGVLPLREILREVDCEVLPMPDIVARPIVSILGRLEILPFLPLQVDYIRFPWTVSGAKAKDELGFEPEISLRETLRSVARPRGRTRPGRE